MLLVLAAAAVVAPTLAAQEEAPERRVVRGLSFVGNRTIDDLVLQASIATTESSWWARSGLVRWLGLGEKRYFDEREFRRDVLRIQALYTQSGFRQVSVDTLVRRTPEAVWVRFNIHEGEPVRVTRLTITGTDGIITPRALQRELPLQVGDPFNRLLLRASADTIRIAFENRGYPYAEVFQEFSEDREALTAEVGFEVVPGPRAVVGRVDVRGAEAVSEETVRRMIPVREGRPYRRADLFESQRDLYAMDVFGYVNVALVDTVPDGPADTAVTVRVQVSEASLHRLRFGAGYGSIDCVRGLGGWTARNFLGGGRRLDLTARVSRLGAGAPADLGFQNSVCFGLHDEDDPDRLKVNYAVSLGFREPYLFNRRTSGTFAVTAERRSELFAYFRESVGGDAALTRAVGAIPVTLSYGVTWGRTVADLATFCSFLNVCRPEDADPFTSRRVQSTLGLRIVRDRRNSVLDPTRGTYASAEVRWASGVIGSSEFARFTRIVGEVAGYHPLGRHAVMAWRLRAGGIIPSTLVTVGVNDEFVPPDERFYAGGPNSVRGFGQNRLGPLVRVADGDSVDTDGDAVLDAWTANGDTLVSPVGGDQLVVANVELRFPLPVFGGRMTGAVYVDAGQVFGPGEDLLDVGRLRFTPGIGARFASPLGPVRMDIAYNGYPPRAGPLFERQGTSLVPAAEPIFPVQPVAPGFVNRLQFHFSVGQAF